MAGELATYQPALLATAAALAPVAVVQANQLLTRWGHYLGACARPFGAEGWVLEVDGEPAAVAVSASTVSATVGGYRRGEVVELARLCSAPSARWATRPMLRLWREVAAPRWSYWPVVAAVAYSHNRRHAGDLYRWDGWTLVTDRAGAPSGPNATWSKHRGPDHLAAGRKTLWIWRYGPLSSVPPGKADDGASYAPQTAAFLRRRAAERAAAGAEPPLLIDDMPPGTEASQ